jgi:ATP-dependent exoDNAse (exonuclease V) beta subunit
MMAEIVKEYGDEIYGILRSLKELHIEGDDKSKANMVFSTVHRAKGMEYDVVYLVDDFITEDRLEKLKAGEKEKGQSLQIAKWNEEINLLYVAVTRARYKLYIPDTLIPRSFPAGKHIHTSTKPAPAGHDVKAAQLSRLQASRQKTERKKDIAYQPWTAELDKELTAMAYTGAPIGTMADYFGRTKGAVYSRLKKLGYFS